jgi:hypothetical protein
VETTSISLTDWMNWVLPELNGPVITILTVCMWAAFSVGAMPCLHPSIKMNKGGVSASPS